MPLRIRGFSLLAAVLVAGSPACSKTPDPVCAGETVQLRTEDVLTVGTDVAYPPFAFLDPKTREPTGFEPALFKAIARELGLKLQLVNRSAQGLVPAVLAHRLDLAASGLRASPELEREVCVSMPYLDADLGIVVTTSTTEINGTDDLDERLVGVVRSSRGAEWARSRSDQPKRLLETTDDLVSTLINADVDAIVTDLPIARYIAREAPRLRVAGTIQTNEGYVIVTGRDNVALVQLVDRALLKLERRGTLDRLRRRWLGTSN